MNVKNEYTYGFFTTYIYRSELRNYSFEVKSKLFYKEI